MPESRNLPIKVILPSQPDFAAPKGGGSLREFGQVTPELRKRLAAQVRSVREHFTPHFRSGSAVPGIAKVGIKSEAIAKSHRPVHLFNSKSCPICAVRTPSELYVAVTPEGLEYVEDQLLNDNNKKARAAISTLTSITPWTDSDALHNRPAAKILDDVNTSRSKRLRVQMFRYRSTWHNNAAWDTVRRTFGQLVERVDYGPGDSFVSMTSVTEEDINRLAQLPAIRSLSAFPDYHAVRNTAMVLGPIDTNLFASPVDATEYGIVGLIDSGTDRNNPLIESWCIDRWDVVPESEQDNAHGTFVAGLLIHPRELNNGDKRFPSGSCWFVDVAVFDRSGEISEYDLKNIIDEALRRFPYVKVWNLSLGLIGDCCDFDTFSPFGRFLDSRSKAHNVLFVIAAGNYPHPTSNAPLRTFPPQDAIGDADRICPPADALRAITVGSIAHKHAPTSCVKTGQPSPFTRRGPAGAYQPKPDLSHFAGNCDPNGRFVQVGVVSTGVGQQIAENIGTSFATPLVSNIAARVFHEMDVPEGDASPLVVKAMMLHSALLRTKPRKKLFDYVGLGTPMDADEVVACSESQATVMLRIPMSSARWFYKHQFPMPASLRTDEGVIQAHIYMTVLHDCPMEGDFAFEYCRSHLRATLGSIDADGKYARHVKPIIKPATCGPERELITDGFKWSPLKIFSGSISEVPADRQWRLKLWLSHRDGFVQHVDQEAVVLITIVDPRQQGMVYNEMVREMSRLAWNVHDLKVRSRLRIRP